MTLSIIWILATLKENKWCIKNIDDNDKMLIAMLCGIALVDSFITIMVLYFILR